MTRFSLRDGMVLAATVAGFVGLVALLYFVSTYFQAATSDSATLALEGQALEGGHLLLHGWSLTLDPFWTSIGVIDAIGIGIGGLRPALLYAGPAIVAAVAIVAGVLVARDGRRGVPAWAGGIAVVVLFVFATPSMEYFFVGHGFHVGTAAYALLAFFALRRGSFGWGWVVAVVLLVAGGLGDLMMIAYAVVPLVLAGLAAMVIDRSWRSGVVESSAAVVAVAVAAGFRALTVALGGFRTQPAVSVAPGAQLLENLGHAPSYVASLLGVTNAVFTAGGDPEQVRFMDGIGIVQVVAGITVLACFVAALCGLVARLAGRGQRIDRAAGDGAGHREPWRLDTVLVIAVVTSAVPFALLGGTTGAGIRYLTASVLFAVVLCGRTVARLSSAIAAGPRRRLFEGALSGAVALCLAASFALTLTHPEAPNPERGLVAWLEAHGLHEGIGGYWSASITTIESRGVVTVRPVNLIGDDDVGPVGFMTNESWYDARPFQFLVYGPMDSVSVRAASGKWGAPAHAYVVGPYHVLVWRQEIVLGTAATGSSALARRR